MISLCYWLQNMGLWHHSCLSLCAQSKAFLISYWLCIVVPHRHGNLESNVLFWGLLGTVGRARAVQAPLQTRRLSSEQVVIQRQLVKNNRHHNQIYIYIYSTCACSLNVKFITSCCCYLSLQQMFFLASQKCDCNWWGVWLRVFVLFFPILNIV